MAFDSWWVNLKAGDKVFVAREKRKNSGMAEVYSNGKKYIHVHLQGTPMRIVKATGCIDEYPGFQVCKDEKDHMDAVWQRAKLRETIDDLLTLTRINSFRPTAAENDRLREAYRKLIGEVE